ncbi:TetR/AcrR family transcriptional regulator [Pseudodesulfovibrio aespoeensis]|uniref:TetR/AcrR family transcriptional regulator n=1 Tax=Pseudodesulfovibrio aespoeensis TaxID=182210 RepID=UPI002352489C|nr:TetR/AcrR family transcriptional regulator [Pseudodesulfovibrio aespoeensis]MCG2731630.1 TetR/AcrR family transcriptional regulator [Pseudodesulfovibrio aespoeensis]
MSRRTRRECDRDRMRRLILDSARQLFVREGFDNVSMRRIAGAIEYSPAAIYRYFKSKREILSTLRDEGFRRFVVSQRLRAQTCPDPLERLRAGGVAYVCFALAEPEYFQLMFCTDCSEVDLEGDLAATSMEAYALFRATVDEAVGLGHFGDADTDSVVFSVWAGVHGLAHLINSGRVGLLVDAPDMEALLGRAMDFILRPGQGGCGLSGQGQEG